MTTLANNESANFKGGEYVFKTTGALDLQMQINDEGFDTVTDGSFSAVTDGAITLPICLLKVINASSNTITIKQSR